MPAVTIHGPPDRRRRPGDGSARSPRVPLRAGVPEVGRAAGISQGGYQ